VAAPRHVLVVDDDDDIRQLCAHILRARGFEVDEASDGRRALAAARLHRPDLLLSDLNMPALNGFELAEALQADETTRSVPLVFVSGDDTRANRSEAERLGAFAFVTKPFDPRALATVVADAIGSRRARPEDRPDRDARPFTQ